MSDLKQPTPDQLKIIAGVADLAGHTGATDFNIEYHELENRGAKGRVRIVWFVYVGYRNGTWEVAAATDPVLASIRAAEAVVDGGQCVHCKRMSTVDHNWQQPIASTPDMPWCAYIYDPSTAKFIRSCIDE